MTTLSIEAIAQLLASAQPANVKLALLLLEPSQAYKTVLIELLFARLTVGDPALQQQLQTILEHHAPAHWDLAFETYILPTFLRQIHQLNNYWLTRFLRKVRDGIGVVPTVALATLFWEQQTRGLMYLIEEAEPEVLVDRLAQHWDAQQRKLDLSSYRLDRVPINAFLAFPEVKILDLSYGYLRTRLYPKHFETLLHLKTIILYAYPEEQESNSLPKGLVAIQNHCPTIELIL